MILSILNKVLLNTNSDAFSIWIIQVWPIKHHLALFNGKMKKKWTNNDFLQVKEEEL